MTRSRREPVECRIERLDLTLFDAIPTQSHAGDKRSWLALQGAVRTARDSYCYLEIGSHLGGSIQQHLLDPRCSSIISIDKRPHQQIDDFGTVTTYENNSTQRMLAGLAKIDPEAGARVTCFDADASDVDPRAIPCAPDLCFIDGEHTTTAVLSDFDFCFRVCSPTAVIAFHDDLTITPALWRIFSILRRKGVVFEALKMDGSTFAIALGRTPATTTDACRRLSIDGRAWLRQKRLAFLARRLLPPAVLRVVKGFYRRLARRDASRQ